MSILNVLGKMGFHLSPENVEEMKVLDENKPISNLLSSIANYINEKNSIMDNSESEYISKYSYLWLFQMEI